MQNKFKLRELLKFEDFIAVIIFSVISIVVIAFQSSRIFSLWDFTNYTDLAARILAGQIPYKDIPLYTQPGSFVDIAISYVLFGKNVQGIYFFIFIKQILTGIFILKIINLVSKLKFQQKIFLTIMISLVNSWSIVPQPTYDADLSFALIFSTWVLIRTFKNLNPLKFQDYILLALCIWLPLWYKQSSGLTWLLFSHVFLIIFSIKFKKISILKFISIFDLLLFSIVYWINFRTSLVSDWYKWAVQMPLEARLTQNRTPIAQFMGLLEYRDLFLLILILTIFLFISIRLFRKKIPIVLILFISISVIIVDFVRNSWGKITYLEINWDRLIAPMIVSIFIYIFVAILFGKESSFIKLINLGLIATIVSNYLAQGIVGSSYAFFPLYLLIIFLSSYSYFDIREHYSLGKIKFSSIYSFSILLITLAVGYYSFSTIRMAYVRFDEPIHRYSKLYGWIGMPGKYLEETQIGIDLFKEFSSKGLTAVWPGEDPVSLFTSKMPATEVSLSDQTTNPYFEDVRGWLKRNDIKYVVLKTRLQTPGQHQISIDKFVEANKDFKEIKQVGVYLVLERIN